MKTLADTEIEIEAVMEKYTNSLVDPLHLPSESDALIKRIVRSAFLSGLSTGTAILAREDGSTFITAPSLYTSTAHIAQRAGLFPRDCIVGE